MSQSLPQTDLEMNAAARARYGYLILGTLITASLILGLFFLFAARAQNSPQMYVFAGVMGLNLIANLWLTTLIRRGKLAFAMSFAVSLFLTEALLAPFFIQGIGLLLGAIVVAVVLAISSLTLSGDVKLAGSLGGFLAAGLTFLLDLQLGEGRLNFPQIQFYAPYVMGVAGVLVVLLAALQFKHFSLRVKVAMGILFTGALAVSAITVVSLSGLETTTSKMTDEIERGIYAKAEEQILSLAQTEAQNADRLFAETTANLKLLAKYLENLHSRSEVFSQGEYWDAAQKIVRMSAGQYGNSLADPASIFIPNLYPPNEEILADLNVTAYLDMAAPGFLSSNPNVSAVYFIGKSGATTYYPNVNLAGRLPPNYDPRQQPFFLIATPQNNPQHLPLWTPPYQDPQGRGLVMTLSIPIYARNAFKGVLDADVQIKQITEAVSGIRLGESGFGILIDKDGRILSMPPQGYELLGLTPEVAPPNESPKQTVFDLASPDMREALGRAAAGKSGLVEIEFGGAPRYVAFAPLTAVEHRLIVVASKTELTSAAAESRARFAAEKAALPLVIYALLFVFFFVAVAVSLFVGQSISSPVKRLTKTVERIAAGDLNAQAAVESRDETGKLAAAVNQMKTFLQKELSTLEKRVAERTSELEKSNAAVARRADQFEIVARIARVISATQDIDELLPQIVETISKQFGFYHVGIFLVDSRREYAILVATNSEGGKKMLARNHRLLVGETGIVGYVTSVGQPRVALDVGADATYFNNPDLPDTHSEIALPLRIGADTFGALDVQSVEVNAFTADDVNILSVLADQVSVAIQNARSYQQSREALAQAERISAQLSGRQWRRFVEQQRISGYYFDGVSKRPLAPEHRKRQYSLSVPLTLRGRQIGAIRLSPLNPNHQWTEDELALIQATADRAALALESARLLEESQKRAAKERTIGEISAKIGGVTDLESIVQVALRELGGVLPGAEINVQFTDSTGKP